jgi:UPF0755 protein
MIKEYRNFWIKNVLQKEQQVNSSGSDVAFASIVHKESVKKDERPRPGIS